MTVDFTQPILLMPDGSFLAATLNPTFPQYNVVASDPGPNGNPDMVAMWESIQAWLAAGNTAQDYEPPAQVAVVQTPAQAAAAKAAQLQADQWAAIQQGLLALANGAGTDPLSVALQGFIKEVTS
jgi:hypothetical protein